MSVAAWIAGALAFLLTFLIVPAVISVCQRWEIFDRPGPLKIHTRPVPRLGGVAIVIALMASALIANPGAAIRAWSFLVALGLVWIVGLVDDLRSLSVLYRLPAQITAGVLLWHGGWIVPVSGTRLLSLAATCTFVAAFINSANFIDGTDGLAAGVACIVSGAYAFLLPSQPDTLGAVVAFGTAGACLAFLRFNFPRAEIFLGDSGSTALGYCLAFLGLEFWRSNHAAHSQMLYPLLVAALPLLDGALAIVRRLSSRASPLYGDRNHIYDRMLARGWSARRVALACYAITMGFVAVAWWGVRRDPPNFWLAAGLSASLLIVYAIRLGSLRSMNSDSRPSLRPRNITKDASGMD